MKKGIVSFTIMILCGSLIIISSCNKDTGIPEVTNLVLKNPPVKMNYFEGDILDLSGLTITLIMDNGDSEDVVFENFESKGLSCSHLNETEITEHTDVIITHNDSGKSVSLFLSYITVIKIGEQFWMQENLNATYYANGDLIQGTEETDTKYWFAYGDDLNNVSTYGRLYTWYAVTDSRNICPDGWHVPTDAEWTTLTTYLGDESLAGGKLKETGIDHWTSPNSGATNETGFTALPGGFTWGDGIFDNVNYSGYWWLSTEINALSPSYIYLDYNSSAVSMRYGGLHKNCGFSVRCLRD